MEREEKEWEGHMIKIKRTEVRAIFILLKEPNMI